MRVIVAIAFGIGFITATNVFSAEVNMNGLVQTWLASGSQASGSNNPEKEIILRRARVGFNMEFNELITGKFQMSGVDLVKMIDAELDLKVNRLLQVRVGRMKYDFDIEGRSSAKALPFPTRPIPTRRLAGLLAPGPGAFRMEGVELTGTTEGAGLGYALGVFNGQFVATPTDKNDFAYLIHVHGKPMEQLKLNASFMKEDYSDTGTDTVWTVGLLYKRDRIVLGAEYYSAKIEETRVPTFDPAGYYAYLTYRMGDFEVGGRYQALDIDLFDTDDITSMDFKVSYYLAEGEAYKAPKITLLAEIRDAGADFAALTFDEKGTLTSGNDVGSVFILELSVPL